jgi:hypothetical protein
MQCPFETNTFFVDFQLQRVASRVIRALASGGRVINVQLGEHELLRMWAVVRANFPLHSRGSHCQKSDGILPKRT